MRASIQDVAALATVRHAPATDGTTPCRIVTATRVLDERPQRGSSYPIFAECDDGVTRIVKWFPGGANGLLSTYGELIASRLGLLLGAPVLPAAFVAVAPELIPLDFRRFRTATWSRQFTHLGFPRVPTLEQWHPVRHLPDLWNPEALPAAVVLNALLGGTAERHAEIMERDAEPRAADPGDVRALAHPPYAEGERRARFWLVDLTPHLMQQHVHRRPPPVRASRPICVADFLTWRPCTHGPADIFAELRPALERLTLLHDAAVEAACGVVPDAWRGIVTAATVAGTAQRLRHARDCLSEFARQHSASSVAASPEPARAGLR